MRVLLVDPVADLLPALQSTLLSIQGMELYCAPDGTTAIQHANLLGGVDVLITEVFLPGVDGFSVRDELQARYPSLLTLFLTRHNLGAYSDAIRQTPVLPIPVNPESVLSALQNARPAKALPVNPLNPTLAPPAPAPAPRAEPTPPSVQAPAPQPFSPRQPAAERLPEPRAPQREIPFNAPLAPPRTYAALYPGASLGPYHVFGEEGHHPLGQRFSALHTTLSRQVYLVVMDPEKAANPELKEAFLADARAKAQIQNDSILAVYEAGELEDRTFYALERITAESVESLLLKGFSISVAALTDTARTVAECLLYLRKAKVPTLPLQPADVLLQIDGTIRIQNIALGGLHPATDTAADLSLFGGCLLKLLPPEATPELRTLLERTALGHPQRLAGWEELLKCLSPEKKATPSPSAALAAPSNASAPAAQTPWQPPPATKHPKRRLLATLSLAVLLAAGALAGFFHLMAPEPLTPPQINIPKDLYPLGSGRRISLEAFAIDSTEVTNRQYFKFIDWVRTHPREAARFDHPEQPPHHSHVPPSWPDMFPEKLRPEKTKADPRWDLPVSDVTWWDAIAFAAWAGRVLPTEEQWEAAGRGPRGLLFPWGDEPEPERSNVSRPGYLLKQGETNSPKNVDSINDPSVFGVKGLSGNVSEWTMTRRDGKGVVKGGHFNAPLLTLDAASAIPPESRSINLGFRTASPSAQPSP